MTTKKLLVFLLVPLLLLVLGARKPARKHVRKTGRSARTAVHKPKPKPRPAPMPAMPEAPEAAVLGGPPQLGKAVNAEVGRALRVTAALGVNIVDLATGESVYSYNADEQRVIASNSKLFTTAAALDALGRATSSRPAS
jgi:D-alanyl-D-alanine carboxypeptidase